RGGGPAVAGHVVADHSVAGGGQRREQRIPHPTVGDARVQQEDRFAGIGSFGEDATLVERELCHARITPNAGPLDAPTGTPFCDTSERRCAYKRTPQCREMRNRSARNRQFHASSAREGMLRYLSCVGSWGMSAPA